MSAGATTGALRSLSPRLHVLEDTCNVYLVGDGTAGLLIDAGSGAVAERLADAGVRSLEWVLHTHFHRDQCWGTPGLVERHGLRVAIPAYERYLFESAREQWQTKRVFDNYNARRIFAPGEDLRVDAELLDYEDFRWRDLSFRVLPAKGHTLGSVALIAEIDGRRVAFTGDLLTAGGHVHELHALEYGYGVLAGVLFTLQSLHALRREQPDLILPSHGPTIEDVDGELALLEDRLLELVRLGPIAGATATVPANVPGPPGPGPESLPEPELLRISEHLVWSGPFACSNFYVLLSGSGEALLIDYGHPHYSYLHVDRDALPFESQRFVVHRLDQLRERFGVHTIEVVCATHAHDDHVAGIPYLQRHHGTACWALDSVADVLERPADWAHLPATFPQPIAIERRLADGERIAWRGFELTFRHAPGHAEQHSLISAEIDGTRIAFTGDNYFWNLVEGDGGPLRELAHHTRLGNGFRLGMHRESLDALRAAAPDVICPGHGDVHAFDDALLDQLDAYCARMAGAFRAIVGEPADAAIDLSWAQLRPYLAAATPSSTVTYTLTLRNNLGRTATYGARLLPPPGWSARNDAQLLQLEDGEAGQLVFDLTVPDAAAPGRTLVTAEVLVDGRSRGPVADALLTV